MLTVNNAEVHPSTTYNGDNDNKDYNGVYRKVNLFP